jgi:hypothetical protein
VILFINGTFLNNGGNQDTGKTGDGMIFGPVGVRRNRAVGCVVAGQLGRVWPAESQGVVSSWRVVGGRRPAKAWVAAAPQRASAR